MQAKIEIRMKTFGRATEQIFPRFILDWFPLLWVCLLPLYGQKPATSAVASAISAPIAGQGDVRSIFTLDGGWRLHLGDDPQWAVPGFNDSDWQSVRLGQSLSDQGIEPYSGYAWYRLRLQPSQLSQFASLAGSQHPVLLVTGNSVGQLAVYVNGVEAGHTRGMAEHLAQYESPPFIVSLSGAGPIDIAIRTWAGPTVTINRGLLEKVELGPRDELTNRLAMAIGHQWNEHAISSMLVAFLFLCVTVLGAALYFSQRHHSEYLWLALLCLTVAAGGAADAAFGLALMPLPVFDIITLFFGAVFIAVTLEFVLRFTSSPSLRTVRAVQIAVLVLPFMQVIHLEQLYEALSVVAEVVFCGLVGTMLLKAWRRGQGEAGAMLLPFFFAAAADFANTVLSFAGKSHWVPEQVAFHRFYLGPIEFGTGTVANLIFLGSLIAVILFRFVRISEREQRSNAEIAAARSVQALLIPTHLPSNRNFMLESAYLPINGVGGDFFQVLPLKDDSLLIVVGDVSGKGLQAAMSSSTLVGALRNELSHDPTTVLEHLNRVLIGAVPVAGAVPDLDCAPCFATCLCARIYPDGTISIANAGHLGPYRDGREVELTPSLPLGVIAESHYEQTTFQLNRGDRLVFISDGVVEATNAQGELFGFERTQQVSHESARYIAQTAQHFGQTDDITVLSLYVASRAAQRNSEEFVYSS